MRERTKTRFRRGIGGFIASVAVLCVLAYGGVAGVFYVGQERLIFRPTPLPASHVINLPQTTEISLAVDGATLSALHFKQPDAKGVIFFLHGNGGNLSSWLRTTDFYRRNKFDVFMIDYRGYGKSTGSIESEAQLHRDVMKAWKSVAPQYAGKKRVIYGRSLGTTLAAKLSSEVASDLTVLVSPFFNLNAMREAHYAWLPAALMRYTFTTDEWLPSAKSPVVIMHGERDELIDIEQAVRLQALAPSVEFVRIEGGTHNNLHHLPQYVEPLSARLAKL
ncbi:MAG: alpha/beta hydrolase [Burkholderiales bacterium]|jgi:alpha-beta hydrolase superfamily lysophospholipase|nr:alpha/beta hydrolase [Betaproteobacteria bacterium]